MKLSKRQSRLVRSMLGNQTYYTVKYYADLIKVSERTIHNDLKGIEQYLGDYGLQLERKPSVGIKVKGQLKNKLNALKYVTSNNGGLHLEELSPLDRQIQITKMLLLEEKTLTYQGLSDYFLVSTSSITGDIETINASLNEYTVKIESNQKGTYIVGTEMQKQYTLKLFTEKFLKKTGGINSFNKFDELFEKLKALYPVEMITISYDLVKEIEKKLTKPIAEHYLMKVFNTIVVLCYRASLHNHHSETESNYMLEKTANIESYIIAKDSLDKINQELSINFTIEDTIYLTQHLIAIGAEPNVQAAPINEEYKTLLEEIIQKMSHTVKVDLTKDPHLYEGLMSHFIPMIYRLTSGIKINNPLLKDIKEQYSVMLGVTWFVSSIIEKRLQVKLTEDEVAFMMVHFQASLERNKDSKRILIVCPTGIGTSELIANKVRRFLPSHYEMEVVPIKMLYVKGIENVDFIISAIPLDITSKPVVHISPLVTSTDIKNITNFYTDLMIEEDLLKDEEEIPTFHYLSEFISEDYIFVEKDMQDKNEVLDFLIQKLMDRKDVVKGFGESVYTREGLGSTALDSGVAIPHGMPQFVVNSKVVILTCKNPINWDGVMIDTILLICISEQDLKSVKSVLSDIYALIESEKKVERFLVKNTKKGILNIIQG